MAKAKKSSAGQQINNYWLAPTAASQEGGKAIAKPKGKRNPKQRGGKSAVALPEFQEQRLTLEGAIDLTVASIWEYGQHYKHWCISFSGGKDSSTVLSLVLWLLETGRLPRPESLTVTYADTRMELPMLHAAAKEQLAVAAQHGARIIVAEPPLEDRFFVRMLGKGYPPPHNGFRWCVGLLKLNPMFTALEEIRQITGERFLTLTGMRVGESAARDQRIALSCSKDDGECSQGWFQKMTPASVADVLAPIIHWRVCHVGDWLMFDAPSYGFPTLPVIEAYGADAGDSEPLAARTGCIRCPVAGHDTTLDRVIKTPSWAYLAPFTRLYEVYGQLSSSRARLRKQGERNKNGRLSKRPMRQGPLAMEERLWGLEQVKAIQDEVNSAAKAQGRPEVWLITEEEEARILELIAANTWPEKWDGTEIRADVLVDNIIAEGIVQPLLGGLEEV
jgi:DNA sulfur modification protein DndC